MSDFAELVLAVDTRDMARGQTILDSFARKAKTTEGAVVSMSSKISTAALQATAALSGMVAGYVSLAAIKGAVDQARDFNAALAETSTLIKGTPAELAALSASAREMAIAFGTDATSQMQAFYEALSGGASSVQEAQVLVEQANKLALGGVTSVQTAVDALTTSVNAYGAANLSFVDASDAMFVAVLAGKLTMDQLAASLGTIVPISSAAGISFDETTAAIAALTTQGLTAATASTSLRQVLASVITPTKQARDEAARLGLSFDMQSLKAKGLAGFLEDVVTKTNGNQESMAQLFGSVEALGAVFAFAGGAGDQFTKILEMMENKTGATDAAAAKMADSFDNRLKRAMSALSDIALGLGETILPVLVPLLEAGAAAMVTLAQNTDVLAVAIVAAGTAYLYTLIPAAVAATAAFIGNAGALLALIAEFGVATVAVEYFGAAMLLSNPVGWVIGAGLLVGGLYAIATSSDEAKTATEAHKLAEDALNEALGRVNATSVNASQQRQAAAKEMYDTAAATVAAARAMLAYDEAQTNSYDAMGNSLGADYAGDTRAASEALVLAEAALQGIRDAAAAAGLEVGTMAEKAYDTTAEMHRLGVEAGSVVLATVAMSQEATTLTKKMADQAEVARLAWIYGENSRQAAQAKHDIEKQALVTEMQTAGVAADTAIEILRQSDATFAMQQALAGASGYAEILYAKLSYLSSAISPAIGAAWQLVAALAQAIARLGGVAQGLANIAGVSGALSAAGGLLSKGMATVSTAFAGSAKTLGTYWEASKKAVSTGKDLAEVLAGTGKGGGVAGGAKAAKKELTEAEKAAKTFADTMSGYVTDGIGKAVDWMVSGFKGGLKGLFDIFKQTISQMISYAIKNRIMIAMGMTASGGVAGGAAAAIPGAAPAGGAGGVLSGIAGFAGSVFSGASGLITSLSGAASASAALSSAGTYMSSILGGATSSLAGFGAAVGAIALPLMAVAAVFSFFKTKTKLLDSGLRLTVSGLDTAVETFKKVKKTKFWGLSSKTSSSYSAADADVADPISRAIGKMQQGIIDTAGVLGIGVAAFDNFATQLKISTKGLSESEALAAVQKAIAGLGDEFADMATGIGAYTHESEGAMAALDRLAKSLTVVNLMADTLGLSFRAVGLIGADMASQLADAFGGLDALNTAVGNYYGKFYTEAERNATATRQATEALAKLNASMPQSRDEYRAMVEAQDLTTESGRALFAALVSMSGIMDQVLPQVSAFSAAVSVLVGNVQTSLGAMITATGKAQSDALNAANSWRDTAKTLRKYIADMRGQTSALTSGAQALAFNQGQFQMLMAQALGGNLEAAGQLTGAADALIASSGEAASTTQQAALAQAQVLAGLTQVADASDVTAATMDSLAVLLGEQLTILQTISDYLTGGGADAAYLQTLTASLGALQGQLGLANTDLVTQLAAPMGALTTGLASLVAAINLDVADRAARAAADAATQSAAAAAEAVRLAAEAEAARLANIAAAAAATLAAEAAAAAALAAALIKDQRGTMGDHEGPKGYASGGDHAGGWRIVGEHGPELEATGPSRIFNASQTERMLRGSQSRDSNSSVVRAIQSLQSEMADFKEQHRQIDGQIMVNTKRSRNIEESWDAVGMPPVRP